VQVAEDVCVCVWGYVCCTVAGVRKVAGRLGQVGEAEGKAGEAAGRQVRKAGGQQAVKAQLKGPGGMSLAAVQPEGGGRQAGWESRVVQEGQSLSSRRHGA